MIMLSFGERRLARPKADEIGCRALFLAGSMKRIHQVGMGGADMVDREGRIMVYGRYYRIRQDR